MHHMRVGVRVRVGSRKVMVVICVEGVHELSSVPTAAQVSCVTCASVAVLGWVAWVVRLGKVVFVRFYFWEQKIMIFAMQKQY